MKVVKIKKHDDYVRFSFTIDTENGKGLEFKTQCQGGISKHKIGKISFQQLDDIDYETEFKVFGEYTNYQKFQSFYTELHGVGQHIELIRKIEQICEETISQKYPKAFRNLSMEDKKEMLLIMIKNLKVIFSMWPNLETRLCNNITVFSSHYFAI